jgi:DNA-binding NarL/FixJ family response regulator
MKTGRVVLADSHLNMLEGVLDLLAGLFDAVLMVADERSLMEAVAAFAPDLVVVDLSLPGAEEANVARRLKGRFPDLRIVVLSVHDEPAIVDQLMGAVAAFVLKRSAATDLRPAVQQVLQGGAYVSPAVRSQPGA